jgi:hypothetical protein
MSRCPNGTRKNKKTNACIPKKTRFLHSNSYHTPASKSNSYHTPVLHSNSYHTPASKSNSYHSAHSTPLKKHHKKRCPNGTRKHRKTGNCISKKK